MLTALTVSGGAIAAACVMNYWRKLSAQGPSAHDPTPPPLRIATDIVTNSAHLALMWPALGLGSWDTGYPNVVSAEYTVFGMSVQVQMLGGQSLRDWTRDNTRDALAHYLHVPSVTVTSNYPGFVTVDLRVHDTLASTVYLPHDVCDNVDLESVPIGVTEDFDVWRLRVLYSHILIAGATGSGKGSVLWSLLAALGPFIRDGLVDLRVADPKGGMEFSRGDRMFTRFATDAADILAMMREAVEAMTARATMLGWLGVRKHVPTVDEPLILVVVDEAAALSAYATREQKTEFDRLMGLLLTQGRAVGVSLIAALQDPSKETMPNRQLFPIRIGLRLDEPNQTAMVHGHGAVDRGAVCDEISENTPGVGYVGQDGSTKFVRTRAFYVSDDDIDRIVDQFCPTRKVSGKALAL